MDKILEALKKILPADSVNEVAAAVQEMLNEAREELNTEFTEKLEEAYQELTGEIGSAEKVAYQGYQEAFSIITDLNNRIDIQKAEFEKTLEEGYEEAKQMLDTEKARNTTLEVEIYEQYDKKLQEMHEYFVGKIDKYMQVNGSKIYEQARRDVLNDPRMAEHKLTLERIVDVVANYLSDEDYHLATSKKLEESKQQAEELKAQVKLIEARNVRLSIDNTKLNENLRRNADLLTENKNVEKKERAEKAKNVSGRGKLVTENVEIIAEHKGDEPRPASNNTSSRPILENINIDRETLNILAGTKKSKD